MDAADSARAHEADPRGATDGEGSADRRRAGGPLDDAGGEVARTNLACVGVEALELPGRDADANLPVEDADRRGHCARFAHPPLGLGRDRDALARRKAVRDERRLQRDDRSGFADLVGDADHGIAPTFATQRAAASSRELGPADEEPRGQRVARTRRVDDGHVRCLAPLGEIASDDVETLRAAFHDAASAELTDLVPFAFVPEHHVGSKCSELFAKSSGAVRADARPRGQVDADLRAVGVRKLRRALGGRVDRRRQQGVAGDVQTVAREPVSVEVVGCQRRGRASIRRHRPLSLGRHEGDDDAVSAGDRADEVDPARGQVRAQPDAHSVVPASCDAPRLGAELGRPGSDVGRLAPRGCPGRSVRIVAGYELFLQQDDHVEQEITESHDQHGATIVPWHGEQRRGRLSTFVVGGLVGASAAFAAARRRRRRQPAARRTPQGLDAFEGAPCYHESRRARAGRARAVTSRPGSSAG